MQWIYEFSANGIKIEASPIVRQGVMFVTSPPGRVMALNATNGKVLWEYDRRLTQNGGEYGAINRGVAILDDKVFVATADARLIALSAQTGAELWQTTVADKKDGYGITGAPLVYQRPDRDRRVHEGDRGVGEHSSRPSMPRREGERWRFYAIPGAGEPGNDSWAGDSWRNGGGPTWMTGSYDAEQDLLYWGVGNPKPDYDVAARKGDNLYTNSVLALRGSTGKLAWYFQFTPADDHDWDVAQIPVLADYEAGQGPEKRLLWANRNGFYYVLDRVSGQFLKATPFAKQTWADGIDERGRPIPHVESSRQITRAF